MAADQTPQIPELLEAVRDALRASTFPYLAALEDEAIEIGPRTIRQIFGLEDNDGIYVGLADGTSPVLTMGAATDSDQLIELQIFVRGYGGPEGEPSEDFIKAIQITQDCRRELKKTTNLTFTTCGWTYQGFPRFVPWEPMVDHDTDSSLMLYMMFLQVAYNKYVDE